MSRDIPSVAYLPTENVARGLDGHNVRMSCKDFAQHWAAELALHILVKMQRHNVPYAQRRTTDRMLVVLADVWQDVCNLICSPVICTSLQAISECHL